MTFLVTCPCNPAFVFFKLGQNSYAEFECPKCGMTYYAKSKKLGLTVDVKDKSTEKGHKCLSE